MNGTRTHGAGGMAGYECTEEHTLYGYDVRYLCRLLCTLLHMDLSR